MHLVKLKFLLIVKYNTTLVSLNLKLIILLNMQLVKLKFLSIVKYIKFKVNYSDKNAIS